MKDMSKKPTITKAFLTDGYKAPINRPSETSFTKGYSAPKGVKQEIKPPASGSAVKPKSD